MAANATHTDAWTAAVASWPYSERALVAALGAAIHGVLLWAFCLFFLALDRFSLFQGYKLPRTRPGMDPNLAANVHRDWGAIAEQVLGTFVLIPAAVYYGGYDVFKWGGMAVAEPVPSARIWARDLTVMLVACDTMFYWVHRACHHPALYKFVHKKHHEYKATNVWASEYFGVIDMILNVAPGILPAVCMGSHMAIFLAFTAFREWQTVQSHAGYDLPFDVCNVGIFSGGARRHDFHHSHNHGCYGDWTPFWDWLCGTDTSYNRYWDKVKNKEKETHGRPLPRSPASPATPASPANSSINDHYVRRSSRKSPKRHTFVPGSTEFERGVPKGLLT